MRAESPPPTRAAGPVPSLPRRAVRPEVRVERRGRDDRHLRPERRGGAMSQKRAAIYARVSTEMQEREGTSLESQVARCRTYAEEQGWAVEYVVEEQGSGG